MIIHNDPAKGNTLTRTYKGPRRRRYTMTVAGWYGGGFSARNDTEALEIFKRIVAEDAAAREEAAAV